MTQMPHTDSQDIVVTDPAAMDDIKGLLFDQFPVLADAPQSVPRMRELILQLAVRGKLVSQDPGDEPVSELLKKIAAEKARLAKEGKIKKQKPLTAIDPANMPYELPDGWKWIQFGSVSLIERGGSPRPIKAYLTDDPNGLNWIKIGDTEIGGKYISSTKQRIRQEGLPKTRMVYPGDFLLTNSMSFGRPYITRIEGCIHDGWLRISPPDLLDGDYLYNLLSSSYVFSFFKTAAAGAVVLNLNIDKVRELPIPIPPLAEQQRIVAKVDQLMALCDDLEARQEQRNQGRVHLNKAALHSLTGAQEPEAFTTHWNRIHSHFDLLYDTPETVPDLRQAILQLAVRGKLVPQNPSDEPASELLKKIVSEKARLVTEGKIRQQKPLSPIDPDEVPYGLPGGWGWVRLGDLGHVIGGLTKGRKLEGRKLINLPYLRVANVQRDGFKLNVMKEIEIPLEEISTYLLERDDILFTEGGDWDKVGRAALWKEQITPCVFQNHIFRLRIPLGFFDPGWVVLFSNSPNGRSYFQRASKQTTNLASINMGQLRHFPMAIPPEPEKKRIVAKVDQLMALCDELEAKLGTAQAVQGKLLDAVVGQVVNGG